MATVGYEGERGMSIGRAFSRAFGVMKDNPLVVLGLTFMIIVLPTTIFSAVTGFTRNSINENDLPDITRAMVAMAGAGGLLYFLLSLLLQGALVRATTAYAEGRRASVGECLGVGLRSAVPLLVVAILLTLGIMLGFLLLIVPGIILYARWAVAIPAYVEDQPGIFGAFGRSARLTKGARWRVLGLTLVWLIVSGVFSSVAGVLVLGVSGFNAVASGATPAYLIINAITTTFSAALGATVPSSLYVELRQWKEGPSTSHLADVFA